MRDNKPKQKSSSLRDLPQGFTLGLALSDTLPVAFFAVGMFAVAARLSSALFFIGVLLCTIAGAGKVLWKLLVVVDHKNIWILNRQLRFLMPTGFLLMIIGVAIKSPDISWNMVWRAFISFPACIFFLLGICGMLAMGIFAARLDAMSSIANWIEQLTNTTAQLSILLGILSALGFFNC